MKEKREISNITMFIVMVVGFLMFTGGIIYHILESTKPDEMNYGVCGTIVIFTIICAIIFLVFSIRDEGKKNEK